MEMLGRKNSINKNTGYFCLYREDNISTSSNYNKNLFDCKPKKGTMLHYALHKNLSKYAIEEIVYMMNIIPFDIQYNNFL